MITHIRGEIVDVGTSAVVVDVAGIGYEVLVSQIDLEHLSVGENIKLLTYEHIRENSHELFGFLDNDSKVLFEQLISVNGVGPKGGLAIMSLGESKNIKAAIAEGNSAYIAGAQGVGKKVAERIAVDLKDKVGLSHLIATRSQKSSNEAMDALKALGYSEQQSAQALSGVDAKLSVEEQVKQALKGINQ